MAGVRVKIFQNRSLEGYWLFEPFANGNTTGGILSSNWKSSFRELRRDARAPSPSAGTEQVYMSPCRARRSTSFSSDVHHRLPSDVDAGYNDEASSIHFCLFRRAFDTDARCAGAGAARCTASCCFTAHRGRSFGRLGRPAHLRRSHARRTLYPLPPTLLTTLITLPQ